MDVDAQGSLGSMLRSWARGSYDLEAGVELLLRAYNGRFARQGQPWIRTEGGTSWVDFVAIPDYVGGLSGGERRFLLLVASLAGGTPVDLADAVSTLDRPTLDLVLAALSHAAG